MSDPAAEDRAGNVVPVDFAEHVSDEHAALVGRSGIRILRPASVFEQLSTGAQTTMRSGVRLLTAFRCKVGDDGASVEINTVVRGRILESRRDPSVSDEVIVEEFLMREALRELAVRSLDVMEGETERHGMGIGQLTIEREAQLPGETDALLTIDGAARAAHAVAFGSHSATWCDLPEHGIAAIVYARRWSSLPALALCVAAR
jgi:hypothetical protein